MIIVSCQIKIQYQELEVCPYRYLIYSTKKAEKNGVIFDTEPHYVLDVRYQNF